MFDVLFSFFSRRLLLFSFSVDCRTFFLRMREYTCMHTNNKMRIHYGNRRCPLKMSMYDILKCAYRPSIVVLLLRWDRYGRRSYRPRQADNTDDAHQFMSVLLPLFLSLFVFFSLSRCFLSRDWRALFPYNNRRRKKKLFNSFDEISEGYLCDGPLVAITIK